MIAIDIELPKDCRDCPLCEYMSGIGRTWCKATPMILADDFKPIQFDGRHEECPIIEIIQCRFCIHFEHDTAQGKCWCHVNGNTVPTYIDNYCCRGERKEVET